MGRCFEQESLAKKVLNKEENSDNNEHNVQQANNELISSNTCTSNVGNKQQCKKQAMGYPKY